MYLSKPTLLVTSLAALVAATPLPGSGIYQVPSADTCNSGPVQCCNSLQHPRDSSVSSLLGGLGIVLEGLIGQVGLSCTPITAIGVGGTSCASQTACCTNVKFSGLIALGCSPINIAL